MYKIVRNTVDDSGIQSFIVKTPYEPEDNVIRVFVPENLQNEKRFDVVLVLPVEEKLKSRYGDGLTTILAEPEWKNQFVYIAPSFNRIPWYIDVKSDGTLQQESYFIHSVIPFVQQILETVDLNIYLLGFSKSGWGALRMFCRFPKHISGISIWDAPLNLHHPMLYRNSLSNSAKNSDSLNELTIKAKEQFMKRNRIALTGYDYFKEPMDTFHRFLEENQIPHFFDNSEWHKHTWDSGWVAKALGYIVEMGKLRK